MVKRYFETIYISKYPVSYQAFILFILILSSWTYDFLFYQWFIIYQNQYCSDTQTELGLVHGKLLSPIFLPQDDSGPSQLPCPRPGGSTAQRGPDYNCGEWLLQSPLSEQSWDCTSVHTEHIHRYMQISMLSVFINT